MVLINAGQAASSLNLQHQEKKNKPCQVRSPASQAKRLVARKQYPTRPKNKLKAKKKLKGAHSRQHHQSMTITFAVAPVAPVAAVAAESSGCGAAGWGRGLRFGRDGPPGGSSIKAAVKVAIFVSKEPVRTKLGSSSACSASAPAPASSAASF